MSRASPVSRVPTHEPAAAPRLAGLGELSLRELAGIGPARERALARLGIVNLRDLLLLVPRRLCEAPRELPLAEAARFIGTEVAVRGRIEKLALVRKGWKKSTLRVRLVDESGALVALFFNQPWMKRRLEIGAELALAGRVIDSAGPALVAPRLITAERPLAPAGSLAPVYPQTEGLSSAQLARLARAALERFGARLEEPIAAADLARLELPALADAARALHQPASAAEHERARRRIALELLLALQARLERRARARERGRALAIARRPGDLAELLAAAPFEPTRSQRTALETVLGDLARARPMARLLQGDVGSGKTLVGAGAALAVARAGAQAALLAPTAILAEQHAARLAPLAAKLGVEVLLVTGARVPGSRARALEALASGAPCVAVGTHALFAAGVRFGRLALAVIDEQQRFGVAERRALLDKGSDVHLLLMTATPIPRTLALALYGDLELVLIDELPPGRGVPRTHVVEPAKLGALTAWLAGPLARGERVFWVAPRIESIADGGPDAPRGAEELARALAAGALAPHGIELVHGRLDPVERRARLERFQSGAARVLIGTSVLEVGLDVPEASVMVVEGAERFGLSQLHQLRGRVGRARGAQSSGARPLESWCFLVAGSSAAAARLRFLETQHDGFQVAEQDLKERGMGDLAGLRQAGINAEGLFDPAADMALVRAARELVRGDAKLLARYAPARRASARMRSAP